MGDRIPGLRPGAVCCRSCIQPLSVVLRFLIFCIFVPTEYGITNDMKKWLTVILSCIVCLVIGYILGDCFPLNLRDIEFSDDPITKGEYYGNWIGAVGAISTFLAVVVALFSTEIRSCFKMVKFDIRLSNDDIQEDLVDDNDGKKAVRYYNSIEISNSGNLNALDCELYIEKANVYKGKYDHNGTALDIGSAAIDIGNTGGNVYIPSSGKKILQIIEVQAPEEQSTPEGNSVKLKPQIKIPGLKNVDKQFDSGKLELTYCLYSSNAKPKRFTVTVNWDGRWEKRQPEMKTILTVDLK